MTNGLEAWDWQQLSQTKAKELGEAYSILTKALQEQKMPSLDEVPRPVLETSAATGALGLLLLVLLIPNTRRALWNVVDTTLAVICLLLLLAVVIGMPFGARLLFFLHKARLIIALPMPNLTKRSLLCLIQVPCTSAQEDWGSWRRHCYTPSHNLAHSWRQCRRPLQTLAGDSD